ncbi:hypothetical protein [Pseudomonas ficuserectae]|uniref:hypothetical protein n=1 Tax=Pseudomonas ficuserectae TaxID=53410 RepID=UPI0006D6034C|nr:hypothetical protein [Pseudomonas ficuserectae]KPX42749.1 Unknown protein sequence [Pseudomonas ficuserectae]RMS33600.1 hypothetical protein ALP68_00375 [Pseudomonas ficuserectae]RMS39449.1 hypothetical protein ALP67_03238 [Pseudomonas ficuserectae]
MKKEIEPIKTALKQLIDKKNDDTLYYPAAFIEAIKIVAGESVTKNLQEPPVHHEYYIAKKEGDKPTRQNVYFSANSGLDVYAQAQLNLKILAVEIRDSAPDFYNALEKFNLQAHLANQKSRVRSGYDDLTLAKAELELHDSIRHQYPALRSESPSQSDSPAKPKQKYLTPQ